MFSEPESLNPLHCRRLLRIGRFPAGLVYLLVTWVILPLTESQSACRADGNFSATSGEIFWKAAEGPYIFESDFLIPSGMTLTVEPGTKILFTTEANLMIEGALIAVGTLENPILFSSVNTNPSPGDWGCLRFNSTDAAIAGGVEQNNVSSSHLEYCIIEYGGQPGKDKHGERFTGTIHCHKSSPILKNLIIRYNQSSRGGGIYCYEFSSPQISDCLFLENAANESGGALACFFYSNPRVENNIFQGNKAGRHGGAIYSSFSSPQILDNIVENNRAGAHGGGFYFANAVTRDRSLVQNNVLLSNRAQDGSDGMFLSAGITAEFRDNCLLSRAGYEIYVLALEKDLDFRGNYLGSVAATEVELKVYDEFDDPEQCAVNLNPTLDAPPEHAPNAPQDVISIALYGDASFGSEWPWPVLSDAPLHIEARALDRNPYHEDWISLHLWSNSSPQGHNVLAWETGSSTGIYHFIGRVVSTPEMVDGEILALVGDTLHCHIREPGGIEIYRLIEVPERYGSQPRATGEDRSNGE